MTSGTQEVTTSVASVDYPRIAVVVLLLAVDLALVGAMSASATAYGPYNGDWNGASEFRGLAGEAAESHLATSSEPYERLPPGRTTAVVLAPESPEAASVDRVRQFVARGGTLVVAGDRADGTNAYLDAIGARARIDGAALRDDAANDRGPRTPIATNVSEHELTRDVTRVALNDATAVESDGATVLINSSDVAYLDENGNGAVDDEEAFGRLPVATVEDVGDGRVVVVSDPDVFTNDVLDRADNRAFARALLADSDEVILDYGTATSIPPLAYALRPLRSAPALPVAAGLAGLGVVGLLARRDRLAARFEGARRRED